MFFKTLLAAIVLNAILALVAPLFDGALYALRLARMPVPIRFVMPVANVRGKALRDSWQAAREAGRRRHEGIDIFAPRGTPVLAATEGVVLRVGTDRLGGNVVWVLGPGSQRHYYAHLDRHADVHAGMRVPAGGALGYVGNTGNAATTPAHLHYGVYTAAGAINPYPLLVPSRASPAVDGQDQPLAAGPAR